MSNTSERTLGSLAVISAYRRGQEVFGQGDSAICWFCLVSGVARRYVIRLDGRRQIVDLLLPGDYFGFTANQEWDYSVEAVNDGTVVAAYPRRRVELLADSDPELARTIREATFRAFSRLQCQLLIVGRITALEKVGSFLLDMAARLPNGNRNQVVLPVSRYDIADYLAVSVETVSRSLTILKQCGAIRMLGTRTLQIMNEEFLEDGESLASLAPYGAHAVDAGRPHDSRPDLTSRHRPSSAFKPWGGDA